MNGRREITEPEITGNARLALGYTVGSLHGGLYRVVEADTGTNTVVLEHQRNGNRYRLSLVQIGGVE